MNEEVALTIAEKYLQALKQEKIDTLILGCTHYPLLQNVIQSVMGESVVLINSADEAAKEVYKLLAEKGWLCRQKKWKNLFYASDDIENFQKLSAKICLAAPSVFTEANADFFTVAQKIHRMKGNKLQEQIQWFEALQS